MVEGTKFQRYVFLFKRRNGSNFTAIQEGIIYCNQAVYLLLMGLKSKALKASLSVLFGLELGNTHIKKVFFLVVGPLMV